MTTRKLFEKPVRYTTLEMYPAKISLEDFTEHLYDGLGPFEQNMRHIKGTAEEPKYIEEWYKQFMAWSEVEEDRE